MRRRAALTALALLLAGCPGPQTIKLEPISRPPGVVARLEAEVERTALALNGGTLLFKVYKAGTEERIAQASLTVVGPTLGTGSTGVGADVAFSPVIPGTYQLRVSAPGYKTLVEGNITVEAKQTLERRLELTPEGGTVKGRVVSGGQPVWGARVILGDSWAFSQQDGTFTLAGIGAGAGTLKVRKGGFQGLAQAVTVDGETQSGDLSLSAASTPRRVALANPAQAFGSGSTVDAELRALMTAADADAGLVETLDVSQAHVRVLASPQALPSQAEIDGLKTFVAGGGTLVVTGEWGGFGDYDPEAINARTRPFGLAVRPDLVRSSRYQTQSDWVIAGLDSAFPTSRNVSELVLYTGCSIMAGTQAVGLASTGAGGYRVQAVSTGDPLLAAATPYGEGLVAVLGDTSAWTGSRLSQAGNRQFMLNLFGW